jgi:hypothetical protein
MRAIFFSLSAAALMLSLGGCAVVKASADVAGAAGRLAGTVVSTTAGAVGSAASAGHKDKKPASDCSASNASDCKQQPQ